MYRYLTTYLLFLSSMTGKLRYKSFLQSQSTPSRKPFKDVGELSSWEYHVLSPWYGKADV